MSYLNMTQAHEFLQLFTLINVIALLSAWVAALPVQRCPGGCTTSQGWPPWPATKGCHFLSMTQAHKGLRYTLINVIALLLHGSLRGVLLCQRRGVWAAAPYLRNCRPGLQWKRCHFLSMTQAHNSLRYTHSHECYSPHAAWLSARAAALPVQRCLERLHHITGACCPGLQQRGAIFLARLKPTNACKYTHTLINDNSTPAAWLSA